MTPSVSYDSEITIEKTAKECWAVMNDESKLSQWIQGYQKSELLSGVAGTKGAVSNVYVVDQGNEMIMKETVNEVIPEKLLAMTFNMEDMSMDMDYKMTFTENNGKTLIKSQTTTTGNGLFARSIVSFMKGMMKSQEDINMNNLKKTIESNTTNYFPEPVTDSLEIEVQEQ